MLPLVRQNKVGGGQAPDQPERPDRAEKYKGIRAKYRIGYRRSATSVNFSGCSVTLILDRGGLSLLRFALSFLLRVDGGKLSWDFHGRVGTDARLGVGKRQ